MSSEFPTINSKETSIISSLFSSIIKEEALTNQIELIDNASKLEHECKIRQHQLHNLARSLVTKAQEKSKFDHFLDLAPVAIFLTDQHGKVKRSNKQARKLLGQTNSVLTQSNIFDWVEISQKRFLTKIMEKVLKTGSPSHTHSIFEGSTGTFGARVDIGLVNSDPDEQILFWSTWHSSKNPSENPDFLKQIAIGFTTSSSQIFFNSLARHLVHQPGIEIAAIFRAEENTRKKLVFESLAAFYKNGTSLKIKNISGNGFFPFDFKYKDRSCQVELFAKGLGPKIKNHTLDSIDFVLRDDNEQILGLIWVASSKNFNNKSRVKTSLEISSARVKLEISRYNAIKELQHYKKHLENLVNERTTALQQKNSQLNAEIEKRKLIEKDLLKATEDANSANRMKSAFLANMSHEIRTPLNGILGIASLLEKTDDPSERSKYVETLKQSGETLLTLLNDILDVSKLEANSIELRPIDFNLYELLEQIIDTHSTKVNQKSLELFLHYKFHPMQEFNLDKIRLRQIVENILTNAIKFTKSGLIEISAAPIASQTNIETSQGTKISYDQIRISIKDSGIGISISDQDQIFNRFHQAKNADSVTFGGTGLGLSISNKLAKLMGGEITLESELGIGSTFHITIPVKNFESLQPIKTKLNNVAVLSENEYLANSLNSFSEHFSETIKVNAFPLGSGNSFEKQISSAIIGNYQVLVVEDLYFNRFSKWIESNSEELAHSKAQKIVLIGSETTKIRSFANPSKEIQFIRLAKPVLPETVFNHIKYDSNYPAISQIDNSPELPRPLNSSPPPPAYVLLAEDNYINQIVIGDMLTTFGYEVEIAADGKEALEKFLQKQYDLIILDCRMPVMSGFEALDAIKNSEKQNPPILALTANAFEEDRQKCLSLGFDEYLAKPVTTEGLQNMCKKLMESSPN